MKFFKFTVKIPVSSEEQKYDEYVFYRLSEVCKFLDIKESCVYKIMFGEYKYSHKNSMRLKGIIINREEISKTLKKELKEKYSGKLDNDLSEDETEDIKKERKRIEREEKAKKIALEYQTQIRNKVM